MACENNTFLLWLIQKALSEHSQSWHLYTASAFEILQFCTAETPMSWQMWLILVHAMRCGLQVWRKLDFSFTQDSAMEVLVWRGEITVINHSMHVGGPNNLILVMDGPALQLQSRSRMGSKPAIQFGSVVWIIHANFCSLPCRRFCCWWLQAYILSLSCKDI